MAYRYPTPFVPQAAGTPLPAAPSPVTPGSTTPTGGMGTGQVTAVSTGGFPSAPVPYGITPEMEAREKGLIYSLPAGGYLYDPRMGKPMSDPSWDPNSWQSKFGPLNANSPFMKYNAQDPAANQMARDLYGAIGQLPTTMQPTRTTPALAALGGSGRPTTLGPSIESILGHRWEGPWSILPQRFSSTPRTSTTGNY